MFKVVKNFIKIRKERRSALSLSEEEKNKRKLVQYTKKAVTVILASSIVWITWNYVLATYALINYQESEPMSTLSQEVCRTVIGISLGYFIKAFAETLSEKTITPYLQSKVDGMDGESDSEVCG